MKIMLVRDRNVLNTNWLVYFVNLLAEKGYEIVLACDTYNKLGSGNVLSDKVKLVNLNEKTSNPLVNLWRQVRGKLFPACFRFKKLIETEKPDLIICYFPVDLFNVTRFQNHNIPIVLMVHNYPPVVLDKYRKKPFLTRWFYKRSFKKVDVFHVLLNSYVQAVHNFFEPKRIESIANVVYQFPDDEKVDLNHEKKRIIYVTRVEKKIKRPHLLIEAFGRLAKDFPDWTVEIWGLQKYPDYDRELENLIKKYHIEKNVFLKGYNKDVQALYRTADIHAFPSLVEGFSLALADGMACGLPSLGFKEALSVNEVIVDGHNGFLADDLDDFTAKLRKLMEDKSLRIKLGKNAVEDMKNYTPEVIIGKWENLINSLVKKDKNA